MSLPVPPPLALRASRSWLVLAGALAWFAVPAAAPAQTDRPNIIVILADDLGVEKLRCYGGNTVQTANGTFAIQTPRLDELASEGVRFTNAYANPICTPTRVELLTSRYTHRNYVGFGQFPATGNYTTNEITFAHLLRDAGYATCGTGKWQLDVDTKIHMGNLGFQEYAQRRNPGGNYYGAHFDTHAGPVTTNATTYTEDYSSAFLMDFITRNRDTPFLVYYPMYLIHAPLTERPPGAAAGPAGYEYYAEMLTYMDTVVGRIVDHVDALGIGDRTLILFMGDNGSTYPSTLTDGTVHPGTKGSMKQPGTHVPLQGVWLEAHSMG